MMPTPEQDQDYDDVVRQLQPGQDEPTWRQQGVLGDRQPRPMYRKPATNGPNSTPPHGPPRPAAPGPVHIPDDDTEVGEADEKSVADEIYGDGPGKVKPGAARAGRRPKPKRQRAMAAARAHDAQLAEVPEAGIHPEGNVAPHPINDLAETRSSGGTQVASPPEEPDMNSPAMRQARAERAAGISPREAAHAEIARRQAGGKSVKSRVKTHEQMQDRRDVDRRADNDEKEAGARNGGQWQGRAAHSPLYRKPGTIRTPPHGPPKPAGPTQHIPDDDTEVEGKSMKQRPKDKTVSKQTPLKLTKPSKIGAKLGKSHKAPSHKVGQSAPDDRDPQRQMRDAVKETSEKVDDWRRKQAAEDVGLGQVNEPIDLGDYSDDKGMDEDPTKQHREACRNVSRYLRNLAGQDYRLFGDPHREEAVGHAKGMADILGNYDEGGGGGQGEYPGIVTEEDAGNADDAVEGEVDENAFGDEEFIEGEGDTEGGTSADDNEDGAGWGGEDSEEESGEEEEAPDEEEDEPDENTKALFGTLRKRQKQLDRMQLQVKGLLDALGR